VFKASEASVIHGFAGYFDSVLYKDVMISINPESHSPGMFSWFPIYFPLRTPIFVDKGATIELFFWRKVANGKVWYEWTVLVPGQAPAPIHNPNGRSYWIGL